MAAGGKSQRCVAIRPLTLTEGEGHINLSLIPSSVKGSSWCQPKEGGKEGEREGKRWCWMEVLNEGRT